jgi:hypothetical protein
MENDPLKEIFRPRGAIAFFITLMLLGILIWEGIYYIMLQRN